MWYFANIKPVINLLCSLLTSQGEEPPPAGRRSVRANVYFIPFLFFSDWFGVRIYRLRRALSMECYRLSAFAVLFFNVLSYVAFLRQVQSVISRICAGEKRPQGAFD